MDVHLESGPDLRHTPPRHFGVSVLRARLSVASLAAWLLAGPAHAAGTFYVDRANPNCSNSGPGTASQPYCSIASAVAARGGPGTTIVVNPGVYREQVTVPASGAAGSPFVIVSSGPGVVVDGADDEASPALWTAGPGATFLAGSVSWIPKQVFVDGKRLRLATGSPDTLSIDAFLPVTGLGLYVNLGGDNPGAHQTFVGHRANGFRLTGRAHVRIEGFEVVRADDKGIIVLSASSNDTIVANSVSACGSNGIGIVASNDCRVLANRVFENSDHGIVLLTGVTRTAVEWNESYRNARPTTRAANGLNLFGSSENRIIGNRLHDNQDSGMQFTASSNDNLSLYNQSWSNGDHGFDHLASTGNRHLGDLAWGNFKDGFSYEGTSTDNQMFNCISADNGLTTREFDLWVEGASTAGFASNSNVLWNSTAQPPVKWGTTVFASVSDYAAASRQDGRSTQGDPRLASPATGDFHLLRSSAAIDNADVTVPEWPARDLFGGARLDDPATPNAGIGAPAFADRGAFEFVPGTAPDRAPAVTAPVSVGGIEGTKLTAVVTATDPDGDPIAGLDADLSALPQGSGATFVVNEQNTSGALTWNTTRADGRTAPYVVRFTARNALTGSATTALQVDDRVDHPPVVSAPASLKAARNAVLTIPVTVTDSDGDAILALTAGLATLGGNAAFVVNPSNTSGTLTWTPARNGDYAVTFTARNALVGTAQTKIKVQNHVAAEPALLRASSEDGDTERPAVLALSPAFPDPSAGAVALTLDMPRAARVDWGVFDIQGRPVARETRYAEAGRLTLRWEPPVDAVRTGVYFARVRVGSETFVRRFLMIH